MIANTFNLFFIFFLISNIPQLPGWFLNPFIKSTIEYYEIEMVNKQINK